MTVTPDGGQPQDIGPGDSAVFPRGCGVYDPHSVLVVIDEVPDPGSAHHLNLPLLKLPTVQLPSTETAAEPLVPAVLWRPGLETHLLVCGPGVACGPLAEFVPAFRGGGLAEPDVPFARDCGGRDAFLPLGAQPAEASGTGP